MAQLPGNVTEDIPMLTSSRPMRFGLTRRLSVAVSACLVVLAGTASAGVAFPGAPAPAPVASAPTPVAAAPTPASCVTGATSTPFAQFGDSADYSPVPGGSFESGAPGWSLTSSAIAAGNETYGVA